MAVVYGHSWQAGVIHKAIKAKGIECSWLKAKADKATYDTSSERVTLLTRQSSKGLEFDTVVLAGLGGLKHDEEHLEHQVRLLYVGMTRARRQLLLTGSGDNWFLERLSEHDQRCRVMSCLP